MTDIDMAEQGGRPHEMRYCPDLPHNTIVENQPVFSAELFPYRSLGRKGFRVLSVVSAIALLSAALWFAVIGGWPIALYCMLTFLALYGAFMLSYRSARVREHVFVSRQRVSVLKVSPSGRVLKTEFNPFWTRFCVSRHVEFGITDMRLVSRGTDLEIGSFLNPEDRESFAKAFSAALATAKQRI